MAEPFLSEIRIMSFGYAPRGWAMCNGQILPINQNQPLFSLLGTVYGGNGQTNFALPDLRAKVPIHTGSGFTLGQSGGQSAHTVTVSEMPLHTHIVSANSGTGQNNPPAALLCKAAANMYGPATQLATMAPQMVSNVGGSQPHENRQPFLALTFCIALQGIFPSPN